MTVNDITKDSWHTVYVTVFRRWRSRLRVLWTLRENSPSSAWSMIAEKWRGNAASSSSRASGSSFLWLSIYGGQLLIVFKVLVKIDGCVCEPSVQFGLCRKVNIDTRLCARTETKAQIQISPLFVSCCKMMHHHFYRNCYWLSLVYMR